MKRFHTATRLLSLCALLVPTAVGCGGNSSSTASKPQENTPATTSPQIVNSEPESSVTVVDGAGTAPAQSVAIFLDSLRRGDERAANAMLTSRAREEMAKTAYALQPLGTPEGAYQIGRVGFPYPEKTVALVECNWSEPPVDGEAQLSMDIVCEVHQEPEGWRISGIGVTVTDTEDALVLDFENAASLQATIDAATGQGASPQTTANLPSPDNGGAAQSSNQLPALPSFPNGVDTPSAEQPQQIALPPLNNAPLNR